MSTSKDITQTGPKALRGIRNPDLYGNPYYKDQRLTSIMKNVKPHQYTQQEIDQIDRMRYQGANTAYKVSKGHGSDDLWSNPALYQSVPAPEFNQLGESVFDPEFVVSATPDQIGDYRAANQGFWAKAGAGIGKGVGLAVTTFLDGTVGLATGIVSSIANGDISKLWDNEVTQGLDMINKAMEEEIMPNYYSRDEAENPWSHILSQNFIFDKFVKNLGFLVGAAYSGSAVTKALRFGLKFGLGAARGFKIAKNIAKGEKAFSAFKEVPRYAEAATSVLERSRGIKQAKAITGSVFSAISEGTVEAVSNSNDMVNLATMELEDKAAADIEAARQKYNQDIDNGVSVDIARQEYEDQVNKINQAKDKSLKELEGARVSMGSADLLANIPILTFDNFFLLGKFFGGGMKSGRNAERTITRMTKQAKREAKEAWKSGNKQIMKDYQAIVNKAETQGYNTLTEAEKAIVEEAPKHLFGKKVGGIKAMLSAPAREGNEEMAQAMASEVSGDYYKKKVDYIYDAAIHPESTQALADNMQEFWKSLGKGVNETYLNLNRWEEGVIGALTGAIGAPTFGRRANSTDQTWLGKGKIIGITGGSITEFRDYLNKRSAEEKTARIVTDILKNPKTAERLKHVVAQITFDRDQSRGIRLNDKKLFKDAETAALFEQIMYLNKAGKIDQLKAIAQSVGDFTDEELEQLIDSTTQYISKNRNDVKELIKARDGLQDKLNKADEERQALQNQWEMASASGQELAQVNMLQAALEQKDKHYKLVQKQLETINSQIEDAQARLSSPYIHKDGTRFTVDEMREALGKKSDRAMSMIDDILRIQDDLDNSTGDVLSDEALATLTYYEVAMKDWAERGDNIINDLVNELRGTGLVDSVTSFMSKQIDELQKHLGNSPEVQEEIDKWKKIIEGQHNLESNVKNILSIGTNLISFMAEVEDIVLKDKEGKEVKVKAKDWVINSLKDAINSNFLYTPELKESRLNDLEDLSKIVDSYKERKKLFEEAIKDSNKIEQAHRNSDKKAEDNKRSELHKKIASEMNFDDPQSIKSVLDKYKDSLQSSEDYSSFLNSLTDSQREAVKEVRRDSRTSQALQDSLEDIKDDKIRNIAEVVLNSDSLSRDDLQEIVVNPSTLDDDIEKAVNQSLDDDGIDDPIERAKLKTERETQVKSAVTDIAGKAEKALNAADLESDREINPKPEGLEEQKVNPTDNGEDSDGEIRLNPEGLEDEEFNPEDLEESPEEQNNSRKQEEVEALRKKTLQNDKAGLRKLPKRGGYIRRRQLTEYYIYGTDGQTVYDYFNEHRDEIPAGVDAEAYLSYLKTVTEFLKSQGAFDYISGINKEKLKPNQTIIFDVEESLGDEKHPVVIMKTESGQIIGTIRTQYEFDIYDAEVANGEPRNLEIEAQRELYKAVIDRHKNGGEPIKTTVEYRIKGSLPLSKLNSSVAKVFEGSSSKPVIGIVQEEDGDIVINTGDKKLKIAYPQQEFMQPGQVYLLVPTNTGTYIPALCFSQGIADLDDNDWYIQSAADTFLKMIESAESIARLKNSFLKWMPLSEFHINLKAKQKKGYKEVANLDSATHIMMSFIPYGGDKKVSITIKISDKNDKLLPMEQIKAKVIDFIKNTAKAQEITVNVNRQQLDNSEYINNISRYLMVNLMRGTAGQHSMNDGFLYKKTDIEKQYEEKNARYSQQSGTASKNSGDTAVFSVTLDGDTYTVSMNGVVRDSKDNVVDGELRDKVIAKYKGKDKSDQKPSEEEGTKKPAQEEPKKEPKKEKPETPESPKLEDQKQKKPSRKKLSDRPPGGVSLKRRKTVPLPAISSEEDREETEQEDNKKKEPSKEAPKKEVSSREEEDKTQERILEQVTSLYEQVTGQKAPNSQLIKFCAALRGSTFSAQFGQILSYITGVDIQDVMAINELINSPAVTSNTDNPSKEFVNQTLTEITKTLEEKVKQMAEPLIPKMIEAKKIKSAEEFYALSPEDQFSIVKCFA